MSLNQFLKQWDISSVSGASFLYILQVSDCVQESEIHSETQQFLID